MKRMIVVLVGVFCGLCFTSPVLAGECTDRCDDNYSQEMKACRETNHWDINCTRTAATRKFSCYSACRDQRESADGPFFKIDDPRSPFRQVQ